MSEANLEFQNFKFRDATSYDHCAGQFERFTNQLSGPLARRLVDLAGLRPSYQVLDIGTGTGIVAFKAAQKLGPKGRVLGIDLSEGMLATAEAKSSRIVPGTRVDFSLMDAESLSIESRSFDTVLSLFALLHFPNPDIALSEMFRVLRPGGTLVLAVGSGPPLSLKGLAHRFSRVPDVILARNGRRLWAPGLLNDMVERYFPDDRKAEESLFAREHHNRSGRLPTYVKKAGFVDIRTDWEGHQAVIETPEEFWEIQRTFSSIARKRLADAPPEKVERLHNEFVKVCSDVQSKGGKLIYPFAAFYVKALRPAE